MACNKHIIYSVDLHIILRFFLWFFFFLNFPPITPYNQSIHGRLYIWPDAKGDDNGAEIAPPLTIDSFCSGRRYGHPQAPIIFRPLLHKWRQIRTIQRSQRDHINGWLMQKKSGAGSLENREALQWKMHRYSKMRAWRSVDFEEPAWKDLSDLKKPNVEQIRATDPPNESSDEVQGGQFGDNLSRAMSLKENAKDKKPAKKVSYRNPDAVPKDNSLQSAVRRVFSMRKSDPPTYFHELISRPFVADLQGANLYADCQDRDAAEGEAADMKSFKHAECMKYSRIADPLTVESDPGAGHTKQKKKERKSVFRACRRLLGMRKNQ